MVNTQALLREMEDKRISVEKMSEHVGISKKSLEKSLNNQRKFRVKEIILMANVLKLTRPGLIFFPEEVTKNLLKGKSIDG